MPSPIADDADIEVGAEDNHAILIVNRPPFHDPYVSLSESSIAEVREFFLHGGDEEVNPQQYQAPYYKKLSMHIAKLWMPPNTIHGGGFFNMLPSWLYDWTIVREYASTIDDTTRTTIISDAISQLLGTTFDNTEDREDIAQCLKVSDTITLGRFKSVLSTSKEQAEEDNSSDSKLTDESTKMEDVFEAYATILFVPHEKSAFVVYVAIHPAMRAMGFGTFLLILLIKYLLSHGYTGQEIPRQQPPADSSVGGVSILLHVNVALNPLAVAFYENRGLEQINMRKEQTKLPAQGLLQKVKTAPFNFVWPKKVSEHGMAWYYLRPDKILKVSSSTHKSITLCLPMNPFITANNHGVFDDTSIYAQLPGNLLLDDVEQCGDGFLLLEGGSNCFKTTDASQLGKPVTPQLQYYNAFLPWCERLRIYAGKPFGGATHRATSIALAWLSRNPSLPLWKERVTVVPPSVGSDVTKAHSFFQRYVLRTDMIANGESPDKADLIFHHHYDAGRFTECMRMVFQFILYHPQIMTNQLTALFLPGDHMHHATTCIVAINPGKFDGDDTSPISLDKSVCGFLHFNPVANDEDFCLLPIEKDNPFLFFLGIASFIWKPKSIAVDQPLLMPIREFVTKAGNDNDLSNNTVFDALVSAFCDEVCSSPERIDEIIFEKVETTYNAGRPFRLSADETETFSGNPNFVQFALPATYPLRSTMDEIAWSDVYCLMFFIDVCNSLSDKDFTWKRSGAVKPIVLAKTYNKLAQTNYTLPFAFEFGKFWRQRIVLSSKKKKKRNRQAIYLSYQDQFSKASFIALQEMFYEITCLMDRLHHKLAMHDGNRVDEDDDYFKYLKYTIDKDKVTKPLTARFEHGMLVPDIGITAYGAKPWDPQQRNKSVNSSIESSATSSVLPEKDEPINPLTIMAAAVSVAEHQADVASKTTTAGSCSSSSSSASSYASHEPEDIASSFKTMSIMSPIGKLKEQKITKKRKSVDTQKTNDKETPAIKELQPPRKKMRRSPKERPPVDFISCQCVAATECAKPGKSSLISRHDILQCRAIRCNGCKEWTHTICLRYRKKLLVCPTCYLLKKREDHTKYLMAPKRPPPDFIVKVPDIFTSTDDTVTNARPDKDDTRKNDIETMNDMHCILDEEMVHRGFLAASDMQTWMKQREVTIESNRKRRGKLTREEERKAIQVHHEYWNLSRTWKKVYNALKRSYLATTPSLVTAIRYDTRKREFFTLVEWQDDVDEQNSIRTATLPVNDEAWVREMFKDEFVEYVKECAQKSEGDRFLPVPCRVSVDVDARVITHVRCCRGLNSDGSHRFKCRFTKCKGEEDISESYLRENFPKAYIDAVIDYRMRPGGQGFINVPAGDVVIRDGLAIPLQNDFGLKHEIKFKQHNLDTCVYSSFASALWCIGIHDLATTLASRATESLHSHRILQHLANDMNGHWLQSVKIKQNAKKRFNLLEEDLQQSIAVVVVQASDGQCSHAITVHDGLVFDGNEDFAIPLTKANLDYICSTNEQKATFVGVASGYVFCEQGKRNRLCSLKSRIPGSPWAREHKETLANPTEG